MCLTVMTICALVLFCWMSFSLLFRIYYHLKEGDRAKSISKQNYRALLTFNTLNLACFAGTFTLYLLSSSRNRTATGILNNFIACSLNGVHAICMYFIFQTILDLHFQRQKSVCLAVAAPQAKSSTAAKEINNDLVSAVPTECMKTVKIASPSEGTDILK